MNTAGHQVAPRWALWSKRAGERDDYSIIEDASDGRDRVELARLQQALLAGTPASDRSGPRALPWISFGPSETGEGERRLGVSIMEWPADGRRDGTGRPISASRYFDLPYREAAEVGAGFVELHRAVADIDLPPTAPTVRVLLEPADTGALVEDIEQLTFDWVAWVAGLLLESRLALTGQPPDGVDHRLRCLDAILALLPYGLRDDLIASTWAPSESEHAIRLAFSSRAKPGQRAVDLAESPPEGHQDHGVGVRYLIWLRRLHERFGLAGLVAMLWQDTQPYSFGAPEKVIASLARHDHLYDVWQRWTRGQASIDEVRQVVGEVDLTSEQPRLQQDLFAALIDHGTAADRALLVLRPSPVALRLIASAIMVDVPERVEALLGVVENLGACQELGERLVEFFPDQHDPPAASRRIAAVLRRWSPPAPGEHEPLRAGLAGQPALAAELLLEEAEEGTADGPAGWVRWLTAGEPQDAPGWLSPFAVALFGCCLLTDEGGRAVEVGGERYLLAILTLAHQHATVDLVLPGLAGYLIRAADPHTPGAIRIRSVLASADLVVSGNRPLADLVALGYGGSARYGVGLGDAQRDRYVQKVADELTGLPRERSGRLAQALVRSLLAVGPALAETTELLFHLGATLQSLGLREEVVGVLADAALDGRVIFTTLPLNRREELLAVSPKLRRRTALEDLRAAVQNGAADEQVMVLWLHADDQQCRLDDVLECLRWWPGRIDPGRLIGLVDAVGRQLLTHHPQPEVERHLYECARLILSRRLGDEAARGSYTLILAEAPHQLGLWHALAAAAGMAHAHYPANRRPIPPPPAPPPSGAGKPSRRKFGMFGPRTETTRTVSKENPS